MAEVLTPEQHQVVENGGPAPIEGGAFVVLRADVYEDLRRRAGEDDEEELRAFARQARKNASARLRADE